MRLFLCAVLYTGLTFGANPVAADSAAFTAALTGEMAKMTPTEPVALPEVTLLDATGAERSLAEYRGKLVLLNFWATWCAPCREEMPALDTLQGDLGGDDFAVVTVAVGRNAVPAIDRFFTEAGVTRLPKLRDPRQELSAALGIFGLPVSVLVDPEGREIARLIGEADWSGPDARAAIAAALR